MKLSMLCLATLIFLNYASGQQNATEKTSPPNILFILVDDMGWSDASCYGQKQWETPNIDRLADQGCRFTNAYAQPLCSPTRAELLTGKYSARLGITDWIPGFPYPENSKLEPVSQAKQVELNEYTLAEALKDKGYNTGIVGKWHIGNHPAEQGFNDVPEHLKMERFDSNGRFMADRKGDAAIDFLEANKDTTFFLYLSFDAVHIPLGASKEKIKKHSNAINPVYAAMMEHVDENVGRVLNKLDNLGLKNNTIVVFYSDNGGVTRHSFGPTIYTLNFPLRGNKGSVYEGGIRVPLIIRYPSIVKPGSESDILISSTDFYPTLLSLCGIKTKHKIDGISFAEALQNKKTIRNEIYWHYPHYSHHVMGFPSGAIRMGDWKLIEWFEDEKIELYNLREDIGEQNNVADHFADKATTLLGKLNEWRQETGAKIPKRK